MIGQRLVEKKLVVMFLILFPCPFPIARYHSKLVCGAFCFFSSAGASFLEGRRNGP